MLQHTIFLKSAVLGVDLKMSQEEGVKARWLLTYTLFTLHGQVHTCTANAHSFQLVLKLLAWVQKLDQLLVNKKITSVIT